MSLSTSTRPLAVNDEIPLLTATEIDGVSDGVDIGVTRPVVGVSGEFDVDFERPVLERVENTGPVNVFSSGSVLIYLAVIKKLKYFGKLYRMGHKCFEIFSNSW